MQQGCIICLLTRGYRVSLKGKVINKVFHSKGHKKEKEITDCLPRDFIIGKLITVLFIEPGCKYIRLPKKSQ